MKDLNDVACACTIFFSYCHISLKVNKDVTLFKQVVNRSKENKDCVTILKLVCVCSHGFTPKEL